MVFVLVAFLMSAAASGGGCATAAPVPAAAATPIVTNGQAISIFKQHVGRSSKAKADKMADFSLAMSKVVPGYTKIGHHEWDKVRSLSHVPYTPASS